MTEQFYRGASAEGARPLVTPTSLVRVDTEKTIDPKGYLPDQGLVDAVNVALMLQQPLLLSGEPGTGKTQLAFSVAEQLGLGKPLTFETKSTSTSGDLFYSFDNLRRFQAAQVHGDDVDPRLFIQYSALGLAIIRTLAPDDARAVLPVGSAAEPVPRRSLVLIDEIDKAPRDFPNDILNEIEHLYFRIPELSNVMVAADSALRPVVIITSNSEKSLPDAFLRRCIFYHIPFPDENRLEEILTTRVGGLVAGDGTALAEILAFFVKLRSDEVRLRKRPGTAELLQWVLALIGFDVDPAKPLHEQTEKAGHTLGALAKHPEDQERVVELFKEWVVR
jgi:MoxR-like ATPase